MRQPTCDRRTPAAPAPRAPRRAALGLVAALAATPAAAAPGDRPLDADWAVSRVAEVVAGWATLLLRSQAELSYRHLAFDPLAGRATVDGLVLGGLAGLPGCRVTAERASLAQAGLVFGAPDRAEIEMSGAEFAPECLGTAARGVLLGEPLRLRTARLDIAYDLPSGGADLALRLEAEGLGRLTATAEADYLAFVSGAGLIGGLAGALPPVGPVPEGTAPTVPPAGGDWQGGSGGGFEAPPDGDPGTGAGGSGGGDGLDDEGFVLRLRHARLDFADEGLVERLRPLLPPALGPSDIAAILGAGEAPAEAQPFLTEAAAAISAFLAAPDRLALALEPEAPVLLDSRRPETGGWAFLAAARPRVTTGRLPPRLPLVPAATLAAVLADPAAVPDEVRRATGLALARGQGAPRDPERAAALLGDTTADAEAALALAEGFSGRDDAEAYRRALAAGAAGAADAPALLDRLEARLGMPAALALQAEARGAEGLDLGAVDEAETLCGMADDRAVGAGAARDYAAARALAGLGQAAGAGGCAALAARIEARMERLADPAPWRAARAGAERAALAAWIAADLPARLSTE